MNDLSGHGPKELPQIKPAFSFFFFFFQHDILKNLANRSKYISIVGGRWPIPEKEGPGNRLMLSINYLESGILDTPLVHA